MIVTQIKCTQFSVMGLTHDILNLLGWFADTFGNCEVERGLQFNYGGIGSGLSTATFYVSDENLAKVQDKLDTFEIL